jgi:hypothetical protein
VGTRDRIMAHLARAGEVSDHTGKASTILAATIGYPGSSIAFAQLLTGMERAGLIQREIRGKRTYRIIPGPAAPAPDAVAQPAAPPDVLPEPGAPAPAAPPEPGQPAVAGLDLPVGQGGLDYDELARRLLVQVVRRLAGPDAGRGQAAPGAAAAPQETVLAESGLPEPGLPDTALQETVASLEQKLASATSRQRRLAEENSRLREQLRAAERSLAEAQDRATAEALAARFDSAEVLLLERLLSPLREERGRPPEADAG